jgi:hypothetical protein
MGDEPDTIKDIFFPFRMIRAGCAVAVMANHKPKNNASVLWMNAPATG